MVSVICGTSLPMCEVVSSFPVSAIQDTSEPGKARKQRHCRIDWMFIGSTRRPGGAGAGGDRRARFAARGDALRRLDERRPSGAEGPHGEDDRTDTDERLESRELFRLGAESAAIAGHGALDTCQVAAEADAPEQEGERPEAGS